MTNSWTTAATRAWRDWRLRRRTLDALRALPDTALRDIGFERDDLERIARRVRR